VGDAGWLKALVARLSGELGFARVGIARAEESPRADRFRRFLARGYHGGMSYLARGVEARCDARSVLEGASGVICLAASYAPAPDEQGSGAIARYARGRDYHRLLRRLCREMLARLRQVEPALRAKVCVDASPVLERDLAAAAGVGWIGRNGCLIAPGAGSYLVLAEIVTDLPLEPDAPIENRCGRCRACVEACPTGAIVEPGVVDSRRCLAYLTIEHRGRTPEEFRPALGGRVFGCDACQEVCPFNRKAPAGEAGLRGPRPVARTPPAAMLEWTQADWDRFTRGSATRRAGYRMFLRNAAIAAGNAADVSARAALERLAGHPAAMVAQAARWGLDRTV
jgi:epoxyqueuosine reductase